MPKDVAVAKKHFGTGSTLFPGRLTLVLLKELGISAFMTMKQMDAVFEFNIMILFSVKLKID